MTRARGPEPRKHERTCARCGTDFKAAHPLARYCGDNCRKRANDDRHRVPCPSCGRAMTAHAQWEGTKMCRSCRDARAERTNAAIIAGYRAGKTPAEIAVELGTTAIAVKSRASHMRRRGVDIPLAPLGYRSHGRVPA